MKVLFTTLFSMLALSVSAQSSSASVQQYLDSLNMVAQNTESQETLSSYSQYRLFASSTFYHDVAANNLSMKENESVEEEQVNEALMNAYLNSSEQVENSENRLRDASTVKENINSPIQNQVEYVEKVAPLPQEAEEAPVDVVVTKPNFWTFKGDYYVQFLQNYISGNWYKGGESNYAMVASGVIEANYDNKGKWKWDNKLEAKLGFQSSRADSIHNLKTSEDLFRLTSKLGLQATKNWYYTLNVLAETQFMRGYKNNDIFTYSDFGSPFKLNISLGMDYKVEWFNKHLTGNIQLSPFAYNFIYVDRLALSKHNGLDLGKHAKHDLGSMITVDLKWQIDENISWKTRLYGFTSYKRSLMEWENEFTFKFNKYISSKLFIYPRFDDSTDRDDDNGYWQFKEYFSLGFSYTF